MQQFLTFEIQIDNWLQISNMVLGLNNRDNSYYM